MLHNFICHEEVLTIEQSTLFLVPGEAVVASFILDYFSRRTGVLCLVSQLQIFMILHPTKHIYSMNILINRINLDECFEIMIGVLAYLELCVQEILMKGW